MGIKENLNSAHQSAMNASPEQEQREDVTEENAEDTSHMQEGKLFGPGGRQASMRLVSPEEAPNEPDGSSSTHSVSFGDLGQSMRRGSALKEMVLNTLTTARVQDAHGPNITKVSFAEFERMREDPEFEPFSKYGPLLIFYCGPDGLPDQQKPRTKPLRPLLQNEVGMWRGNIIVLKDAGPGDYGEGKYHTVGVDIGGDDG